MDLHPHSKRLQGKTPSGWGGGPLGPDRHGLLGKPDLSGAPEPPGARREYPAGSQGLRRSLLSLPVIPRVSLHRRGVLRQVAGALRPLPPNKRRTCSDTLGVGTRPLRRDHPFSGGCRPAVHSRLRRRRSRPPPWTPWRL